MSALGAGAIERLRSSVDPWFVTQGVPHFSLRYSWLERAPALMLLLSPVVAFEVGPGPWIELSATQLLLAPAILVGLVLWLRSPLAAIGARPGDVRAWTSLATRTAVFAVVISYVLARNEMPRLWSDAWVDFLVVLGGLATFVLLFDDDLWQDDALKLARRRRRLVVLIAGAIVVFACEGSVIDPFGVWLDSSAIAVLPAAAPVPQALPALLVIWVVFAYSLWLVRTSRTSASPAEAAATRAESSDASLAKLIPAVPLGMLILSGETAVLPHAVPPGWLQAAVPLLLVVALAPTLRRPGQPSSCRDWAARATRRGVELLRYPVLVYLLAYPIIVGVFLEVDAFGHRLTGIDAFALTLSIHLLYLLVGGFVLSFGLDRVAAWAGRGAAANRASVVKALARGLPLLLLFSGILVFTAEIWEVAVEMSTPAFLGLIALLVALTGFLVLFTALHELARHCRFESEAEVRASALGPVAPPPAPFADALEDFEGSDQAGGCTLELRGKRKVNAVAVFSVYQALVFLPVVIATAVVLWALGRLAVPPDVAAEWIYGDGTPARRGDGLVARSFLDEPWTRVAMLLSVFSLLYLAATVLSDRDDQAEFFDGADRAIRQRLAVALVYERAVGSEGVQPAPGPARRLALRVGARPAGGP